MREFAGHPECVLRRGDVDDGDRAVERGRGTARFENAANDERLVSLLRHNSLPVDDLGGEAKKFFALVTATGEVAAVAGIELGSSDAMMRSVAVADAYRGKGLGRAIVRNLLADLRRKGVNAVYILTQSAEKFFAELGFSKVERSMVPKAVTETSQFTGTRCSSASAMMLKL